MMSSGKMKKVRALTFIWGCRQCIVDWFECYMSCWSGMWCQFSAMFCLIGIFKYQHTCYQFPKWSCPLLILKTNHLKKICIAKFAGRKCFFSSLISHEVQVTTCGGTLPLCHCPTVPLWHCHPASPFLDNSTHTPLPPVHYSIPHHTLPSPKGPEEEQIWSWLGHLPPCTTWLNGTPGAMQAKWKMERVRPKAAAPLCTSALVYGAHPTS